MIMYHPRFKGAHYDIGLRFGKALKKKKKLPVSRLVLHNQLFARQGSRPESLVCLSR